MSDATGFGTGGTSGLLTAGINSNSPSCNTTDPGTDFTYELNSALQQCRPYTWEGYETAVQPLTIIGLIPLGKVRRLLLDVLICLTYHLRRLFFLLHKVTPTLGRLMSLLEPTLCLL